MLPSTVVPSVSYRVTVAPASLAPTKVGVLSLVMLSPSVPLSDAPLKVGRDGAAGARVSKERLSEFPAPPLPTASV